MKCLLASPEPIALSVQIFALSSFLYSHLWDILSSYVSDKSHLVMSYYLRLHGHIPLSMEFSRQEYWSGLPFPPPGDFRTGLLIRREIPGILVHIRKVTWGHSEKTVCKPRRHQAFILDFLASRENKFLSHPLHGILLWQLWMIQGLPLWNYSFFFHFFLVRAH